MLESSYKSQDIALIHSATLRHQASNSHLFFFGSSPKLCKHPTSSCTVRKMMPELCPTTQAAVTIFYETCLDATQERAETTASAAKVPAIERTDSCGRGICKALQGFYCMCKHIPTTRSKLRFGAWKIFSKTSGKREGPDQQKIMPLIPAANRES